MTLYEFNMLDQKDRYTTIWQEGTNLDTVIVGSDRIALYSIDRFFVEVYYDNISNKLIKNVSFKQGDRLDKYSNLQICF